MIDPITARNDFSSPFSITRGVEREGNVLPCPGPSSIKPTSAPTGDLPLRRRRLRPERFYALGASSGDLTVGEVTGVKVRVEVGVGQFGPYGQPARSNSAVAAEQVQPKETKNAMTPRSISPA